MSGRSHNRKRKRTSKSWQYFSSNEDNTVATCNLCKQEIKTTRGCTSGLIKHLSSNHGVQFAENSSEAVVNPDHLICKLVAQDGLPFVVLTSSSSMKLMYESTTHQTMPNSPNTIRDIMIRGYNEKKGFVMDQIKNGTGRGDKYSLTLDEWTSGANKRYMNVNLHSKGQFWNLGLSRIIGSFSSEACLELLEQKLVEFDISLNNDIFGVCTDGASVMKRFGQLSGRKHQLCLAHGIHLAVVDVLYKPNINPDVEEVLIPINDDDGVDETDTAEPLLADEDGEVIEFDGSIDGVITRVRKTVKLFRKSAKKLEVLQSYAESTSNLILDTKTRWNSLVTMLERVFVLKDAILKATIDLQEQAILTEFDFNTIEELVKILKPVKIAVEKICRTDATLITADVSLNFMMQKLSESQSELGKRLFQTMKIRILERRTAAFEVASFLHYGKEKDSPGYTHGFFSKLSSRNVLINTITTIYDMCNTIVNDSDPGSANENTEFSEALEFEVSLEAQLSLAIKEAVSYKQNDGNRNRQSRDQHAALVASVKKELYVLETGGIRGRILQSVYDKLMTVPPSTVEAERVFSSANNFCRKIRTRLSDRSLNALVFLKAYFQKFDP